MGWNPERIFMKKKQGIRNVPPKEKDWSGHPIVGRNLAIFRTTADLSPDLYSEVEVHYRYRIEWVGVDNFGTDILISVEYIGDTDVDDEGYPCDASHWQVRFAVTDRNFPFFAYFFAAEGEWMKNFGRSRSDIKVFENKLSEVVGVAVQIIADKA